MIPYNFQLNIDLVSDWNNILRHELNKVDFLTPASVNAYTTKELPYVYFALLNKLIEPKPRKVHFSKQFQRSEMLQNNLDNIVQKMKKGENLTPHLSKTIRNLNFSDDLLCDWGIYHLHLGIETESDGFVKRGGSLLYAFFTETDAYLIDIMDHQSFAKKRLIEIVHENWPEVIASFKVHGFNESYSELTDADIKKHRKSGANILIRLNSKDAYIPPGGGRTCAGTSVSARIEADQFIYMLKRQELLVKQNIHLFTDEIKYVLGRIPPVLNFELMIDPENKMRVKELASSLCFLIEEV